MAQKLIDISSWQHVSGAAIDWAAVAASGVAGVIIKVTQGATYASPYFAADYADARAAGLLVGAYHYAEPVAGQAETEAAWCNQHVAGLDLPLGLWLDLEQMTAGGAYDTANWATQWLTAIEVATRKTGVYMDQNYLTQMTQLFPAYPLWFATGGDQADPAGVTISQGVPATVNGIQGLVDQDLLLSERWVNPGPVSPTPAPPAPKTEDEDMRYVVATGDQVGEVKPGDQYIVFGSAVKYPVTAEADVASFTKADGPPQEVTAGWLANIKDMQ